MTRAGQKSLVDRLHNEAKTKKLKQERNEQERLISETRGCTFVPNYEKRLGASKQVSVSLYRRNDDITELGHVGVIDQNDDKRSMHSYLQTP